MSRTDQRTDGRTWVGARDTCVSKNGEEVNIFEVETQIRKLDGNQELIPARMRAHNFPSTNFYLGRLYETQNQSWR